MTHQTPIPSLTYHPDRREEVSFVHPLEDPVHYVREVTAYRNRDDRTLTVWVRGQWQTLSGARSKSSRGAKVNPDDKDNPEWLKAIITDAKRRLNAL